MNHKQRAYTLLEMLAIIMAIVVLMALSVRPMRAVICDIPRSMNDFQAWEQIGNILDQLQTDVKRSARMRVFPMDSRISGNLLYLEQTDGLVSYTLTNNQVVRQSDRPGDREQDIWELPHVQIQWSLWENNDISYALEITTWSQREILGQTQEKFKQSYVFFQQTGSTNP